jgi:sugar lactone lactonase YvrE
MTKRRLLVNPIADLPKVSFNDAKCDRQGRLWAGTTDRLEAERIGCLYRIDADRTASIVADDFICSNGPSFSPDGRIMYHTCSHERTIYAYDIDLAGGQLSNRRVFVVVDALEGVPDGSTVDAEGYLWSTHWGGSCITRYAPDGRVDRKIEMPVAKITQTVRKLALSGFLRGIGHVRITHDSHRRIGTRPASVAAGGGGRLCRLGQSGAVHRRLR